jgi:hypothetical protein
MELQLQTGEIGVVVRLRLVVGRIAPALTVTFAIIINSLSTTVPVSTYNWCEMCVWFLCLELVVPHVPFLHMKAFQKPSRG